MNWEADEYEVVLAPWRDYVVWPANADLPDIAWIKVGFRGTWKECDAHIQTLPDPGPMFAF